MLIVYTLVLSFSSSGLVFSITLVYSIGSLSGFNESITTIFNLAYVSIDPSVELCVQYRFKSSPITAEEVLLQVVGADGLDPILTDLIGVNEVDEPLSFIDLTLKKYSWPTSISLINILGPLPSSVVTLVTPLVESK